MSNVFCCISQRALYGHLLVLADAPQNDPAGASVQSAFKDLWHALYDDPALLKLPFFGDESYPWNVVNNQYPELDAKYKDTFKIIYEFWRFLHGIAMHGDAAEGTLFISKDTASANKVTFKPVYNLLLEKAGFSASKAKTGITLTHICPDTAAAMKKLADVTFSHALTSHEAHEALKKTQNLHEYVVKSRSLFDFMRCSYDGGWEYIIDRIDTEQNMNGQLTALAGRCRREGYTFGLHPECNASSTSGFGIDIMRGTGGFHITYNPRKTRKFGFGTKNGIGEKKMLENFSALDDDMKRHFINVCRPCSMCMGCTKGGRNKPFTVKVMYDGAEHALCPQFPQHEWESLTPEITETLFKYHELQEIYG